MAYDRTQALSMRPSAGTIRGRVLSYLEQRGPAGATDDEIVANTGLARHTASARRRELVLGGFVKDSGNVRRQRRGYLTTVWVLTADWPEANAGAAFNDQRSA